MWIQEVWRGTTTSPFHRRRCSSLAKHLHHTAFLSLFFFIPHFSLEVFYFYLFIYFNWHWMLPDLGPSPFFLFFFPSSFLSWYSVSLLAQSRNQFQSLFWVIITCWRTICWRRRRRRRGWRPATSRARNDTLCQTRHLVGWSAACTWTELEEIHSFIYSQCTYYLLVTR